MYGVRNSYTSERDVYSFKNANMHQTTHQEMPFPIK